MKTLGLDLSTKTGWSFWEDSNLVSYGLLHLDKPVCSYGTYPYSYLDGCLDVAIMISQKISELNPDQIVIEETNLSKFSRYSQKILEFIHGMLLLKLKLVYPHIKVYYVSSSVWRKAIDMKLSKEDKKNNQAVNKAKRDGKSKKKLGLTGKITKKHLAVMWVNDKFNLNFKMKDNDIADCICLAYAFLNGAEVLTE